jgi:tetratricopeptide (TPR) repeat protein
VDDLTHELTSLRHKVVPEWGAARSERAYRELGRIRRRRRARNIGVVAALAVGSLGLGAAQVVWPYRVETARVLAAPVPSRVESAEQRVVEAEIVTDSPLPALHAESLMKAVDAAQSSEDPETAASNLRKLLAKQRGSPAAAVTAFMLGRVLLEQLGRPVEAAAAFATARELAPQSSLAHDALAREVESWSKAGHAKEAYDRSQLFMERYPRSRRLRVVQLYGGIATH